MRPIALQEKFFLVGIIGAGPAGLCCAYELSKNRIGPILIVEKGDDIFQRNHKFSLKDYTEGIGGPGLYGDAKFCIYGRAGTKLINFLSEKLLNQLANYVDEVFNKFNEDKIKKEIPSILKIKKLRKVCESYGFRLRMAYPIRHLGFPNGKKVVKNFVDWLKNQGVYFLIKSEVRKILQNSDHYKILIESDKGWKTLKFKYLIAAVGRGGNYWLKNQCDNLNISSLANIPDIGVRIECPRSVLSPIYSLVKNPRIELPIGKNYVKTHCLCMGGEVIIYKINNVFLVDGHVDHENTESTHLNLLYHSPENKKFFNFQIKKPIIQKMEDFLRNQPSGEEKIKKNKLKPSTPLNLFDCETDINKIISPRADLAIKRFINKFNKICPGFNHHHNLVYAPVVEWNTYQIEVNRDMETRQRNFYVIGDGSGLTQGIIAAGVSGIIAAKSIIKKEKRTAEKCGPLESKEH